MSVRSWDPREDGQLTEANMRRKLERLGYCATTCVYPPGTYFPDHTHEVDKIDGVLQGRFRIVLEGRTCDLGPGDLIAVPRGGIHSAEVIGEEPVISLDAVRTK